MFGWLGCRLAATGRAGVTPAGAVVSTGTTKAPQTLRQRSLGRTISRAELEKSLRQAHSDTPNHLGIGWRVGAEGVSEGVLEFVGAAGLSGAQKSFDPKFRS